MTLEPRKKGLSCLAALMLGLSTQTTIAADIVTFDEAINGLASFSFDANNDGLADVIFSTSDEAGFNTIGPGFNMNHVQEPGLEGTTFLDEDLRVDFLSGATGNLEFGFALSTGQETAGVNFSVYDANDQLLNSGFQGAFFTETNFDPEAGSNPEFEGAGEQGLSSFPEAIMSLNFPGVASYAIFDFDEEPGRYIVDNFTGTFNAADEHVAAPGSLPDTALLPDNTDEPFYDFAFNIGEDGLGTEFPIFIDPDVAIGYEYEVDPGSPLITSVIIPAALANGDDEFILTFNGTDYLLKAGELFDILAVSNEGIEKFTITGIDTNEMLDPSDAQAFITGLTFESNGLVSMTQTPIVTYVAEVSEPGSLALLCSGLFGLLYVRRRKA